uniref:sensor histidine kinase n=1 Tax=Alistipes sp. TaxID=1872444 RepID=UPI004057B0AC
MGRTGRLSINIRKQVIGENALYFFIWLSVFLVPFMSAGLMAEQLDFKLIIIAWLKIVPFYLLFVLNHYLLFRYLHRRYLYWVYYLVSAVLIVSVFSALEVYEQSDFSFALSWGTIGESVKVERISLTVFPWWGNMIAAVLMFLANNLIYIFYRAMENEEDAERLQRQNVQAEMYYLKHQINPHFLMNTLNNIHALVDIDSETAKQAIIQLSDMMRYVVYDTGSNAISLRDDIKFIKNYIELMRIRYTDDVSITFTYPQDLQGRVNIPPLIFIVFVENAFKHGISYNSDSYINIDIYYEDGAVVGRFENSVSEKSQKSKHGIGLENVRKRLDLIYANRYDLRIENSERDYCVILKIPTLDDNEMHSN